MVRSRVGSSSDGRGRGPLGDAIVRVSMRKCAGIIAIVLTVSSCGRLDGRQEPHYGRLGLIVRAGSPFAIEMGTCPHEDVRRVAVVEIQPGPGHQTLPRWEIRATQGQTSPFSDLDAPTGHIFDAGQVRPYFEETKKADLNVTDATQLEAVVETSNAPTLTFRFTMADLKGLGDRVLTSTDPRRTTMVEDFEQHNLTCEPASSSG